MSTNIKKPFIKLAVYLFATCLYKCTVHRKLVGCRVSMEQRWGLSMTRRSRRTDDLPATHQLRTQIGSVFSETWTQRSSSICVAEVFFPLYRSEARVKHHLSCNSRQRHIGRAAQLSLCQGGDRICICIAIFEHVLTTGT